MKILAMACKHKELPFFLVIKILNWRVADYLVFIEPVIFSFLFYSFRSLRTKKR